MLEFAHTHTLTEPRLMFYSDNITEVFDFVTNNHKSEDKICSPLNCILFLKLAHLKIVKTESEIE